MTFDLLNRLLETAADPYKRGIYELQSELIDQGWDDVSIDKKLMLKLTQGSFSIYLRSHQADGHNIWQGYDRDELYGDGGILPDGVVDHDEVLFYTEAYLDDLILFNKLVDMGINLKYRVTIEPLGAEDWATSIKLFQQAGTEWLFAFNVHRHKEGRLQSEYMVGFEDTAEHAVHAKFNSTFPTVGKLAEYIKFKQPDPSTWPLKIVTT